MLWCVIVFSGVLFSVICFVVCGSRFVSRCSSVDFFELLGLISLNVLFVVILIDMLWMIWC